MKANPELACICGYDANSKQDLDEHITAASPLDPEGTHRPER
jgi:hypothetical protein